MSMMSAPCLTTSSAGAIAFPGSKKRPPSENESGVQLRMPITSGRPRSSRPASHEGGVSAINVWPVGSPYTLMALLWAADARLSSRAVSLAATRTRKLFVGDFELQFLGALDPIADHLFGRQQIDHFASLVGFRHRLGEVGTVQVLGVLYGLR